MRPICAELLKCVDSDRAVIRAASRSKLAPSARSRPGHRRQALLSRDASPPRRDARRLVRRTPSLTPPASHSILPGLAPGLSFQEPDTPADYTTETSYQLPAYRHRTYSACEPTLLLFAAKPSRTMTDRESAEP